MALRQLPSWLSGIEPCSFGGMDQLPQIAPSEFSWSGQYSPSDEDVRAIACMAFPHVLLNGGAWPEALGRNPLTLPKTERGRCSLQASFAVAQRHGRFGVLCRPPRQLHLFSHALRKSQAAHKQPRTHVMCCHAKHLRPIARSPQHNKAQAFDQCPDAAPQLQTARVRVEKTSGAQGVPS